MKDHIYRGLPVTLPSISVSINWSLSLLLTHPLNFSLAHPRNFSIAHVLTHIQRDVTSTTAHMKRTPISWWHHHLIAVNLSFVYSRFVRNSIVVYYWQINLFKRMFSIYIKHFFAILRGFLLFVSQRFMVHLIVRWLWFGSFSSVVQKK